MNWRLEYLFYTMISANSESGNKLSKRRRGYHSRAKVLITTINEHLETPDPEISISAYLDELKRTKDTILKLDEEILDGLDDGIDEEISNASVFLINMNNCINMASRQVTQEEIIYETKLVKLLNIEHEKFNGNSLKWVEFWNMYKTNIHDRSDISKRAKFQYLVSQLEGDALDLISGLDQTEGKYDEAINLLFTTYGEKKLLIQARLNALFDLEAPTPTSEGLSNFVSAYEGHLEALSSLGANIQEAGYVYAQLLLRKLPSKDHINREHKMDFWDLPGLRTAISKEITQLHALESQPLSKGTVTI